MCIFFFFKQKTAYELRISDWSSDVCSSDLSPDRTEPSPFWRDRRRQQQVRSRAGYLGELGVGFRPLPQTPPSPPMCGKAGYSSTTRSSPKSACRNSLETSERGLPGFLGKIRIRHSISRRLSLRTGKCWPMPFRYPTITLSSHEPQREE